MGYSKKLSLEITLMAIVEGIRLQVSAAAIKGLVKNGTYGFGGV